MTPTDLCIEHPSIRDPRTGSPLRAVGVLPSGKVVWPVMGGDGTGDGGAGDGGQGGAGGAGAGSGAGSGASGDAGASGTGAGDEKKLSQAEVNAITARETEKAKNAALQQVATDLGVSLDEAKTIIQQAKDADAAKMSEAEKREAAAAKKEQEATARETAAALKERDATVRAILAEAGCGKDDMADARRLVDLPDGDIDEKTVTAAVEDLQKRRPELFGGTKATPPAGFTPPGSPNNANGGKPSSMAERREHYRKQREATQKTA